MAMTIEETLTINSKAFNTDGDIPKKYSCEGENVNPPFDITGIPEETRSLAVIMEDPDAPGGTFIHWLCWNISPNKPIAENSNPGINGENGKGHTGYTGPCPPTGSHRYYFKIYALDARLDIKAGSHKEALLQAMEGHILAAGEIMGHYQKGGE
jgi:Raf kinase inhibitor-like YbhB/YbcL family protein